MTPWNKGKSIGPKPPLSADQVEAIRLRLKMEGNLRDIALFETWISTMLRGSDVRKLIRNDVMTSGYQTMKSDIIVRQKKVDKGVIVPLTERAQTSLLRLIEADNKLDGDYLFTRAGKPHGDPITTMTLHRLVKKWVKWIGADAEQFSTHSMRRTRSSLIYERTGNIEAVRQLLGHASIATTQVYLGVSTKQALSIASECEV